MLAVMEVLFFNVFIGTLNITKRIIPQMFFAPLHNAI